MANRTDNGAVPTDTCWKTLWEAIPLKDGRAVVNKGPPVLDTPFRCTIKVGGGREAKQTDVR